MWNYKCRVCGCSLDPGEGYICDDCRDKEKSPLDTPISKGQHSRSHAVLKQIHNNMSSGERTRIT